MHPETPYRLAVLSVALLAAIMAVSFRIQAHRLGGNVARRGEGWFILVSLRLAALVLSLATTVYVAWPDAMQGFSAPLARWLRWLGLPLAALGVAMYYGALSHLGANLTDTVAVRARATLITDGPYRWVRHPMYVACLLIFAGVTLLTANVIIGLSGLIVLALLVLRTPREEAQLLDRFGEEYRSYTMRTGRFWPRLRPPDA